MRGGPETTFDTVRAMDAEAQLAVLGGAVISELGRRGLTAHDEECTRPAFGAVALPGRQIAADGRAERVSVWIEDAETAWVELTWDTGTASAEIGTGFLSDPVAVRWLADMTAGEWRVRRSLRGTRQVRTAGSSVRLTL